MTWKMQMDLTTLGKYYDQLCREERMTTHNPFRRNQTPTANDASHHIVRALPDKINKQLISADTQHYRQTLAMLYEMLLVHDASMEHLALAIP